MKQVTAFCAAIMLIVVLSGCSTPSDYGKACAMSNGNIREDCDKPGQSDESKDYQPK